MTQRLSYDEWFAQADRSCWTLFGVSAYDLPDYCWRDAYDRKRTPQQAAKSARKAAESF